MNAQIPIQRLLPAWETFRKLTDIAPIRDEAHYQRMAAVLEALLDEATGNEEDSAMGLIDIVGDLIEDKDKDRLIDRFWFNTSKLIHKSNK